MTYPISHKTVFVMDRGPAFSMPCVQVEFDFHRARAGGAGGAMAAHGYIPSAPVTKTMWTTATESVLEYCRLVWDLFPTDRLVRFLVAGSDFEPASINSWDETEQNPSTVSTGFARFGRPRKLQAEGASGIMGGLALALESLCQSSTAQRARIEAGDKSLLNRGRIVLLTHLAEGDREVETIIGGFRQHLDSVNRAAAAAPEGEALLPIDNVCSL